MSLDVKGLFAGMESQFGGAVIYSAQELTTAVHLLTPDGLPVHVGQFNQGVRRNLTASTPTTFGLTQVADNAATVFHRLMLAQQGNADFAIFAEEEVDRDLGEARDLSHVTDRRRVSQPALGGLIRSLVAGAKIMDRDTALTYGALSRVIGLDELRIVGKGLWTVMGDERTITDAFLDECAKA